MGGQAFPSNSLDWAAVSGFRRAPQAHFQCNPCLITFFHKSCRVSELMWYVFPIYLLDLYNKGICSGGCVDFVIKKAEEVIDSEYERWLMIVDDSGSVINITKLDEKANSIEEVIL